MCRKTFCAMLLLLALLTVSSCSTTPREKTEPDVVFVPTPHRVVREMLKLADVKKDDVVYDLGSGDGRIVIAAARDFGARAIGIELDQKLVDASIENAKAANVTETASFMVQDIFKADIRQATVVTMFLLPGVNKMLIPKLFKELQPGTRIVSHMFDMGDWKPDMTLKAYDSTVHYWFMPANVDGDWSISVFHERGTLNYRLTIDQDYQKLRGTDSGKKIKFRDMRLYGKEISMFVEDNSLGLGSIIALDGLVKGDAMEGTAEITVGTSTGRYPWKGTRIAKN
jgi:precorrin-6B methylase 2